MAVSSSGFCFNICDAHFDAFLCLSDLRSCDDRVESEYKAKSSLNLGSVLFILHELLLRCFRVDLVQFVEWKLAGRLPLLTLDGDVSTELVLRECLPTFLSNL